MFEAKLSETGTLKKFLFAINNLVSDANFECSEDGMVFRAMDNSHVSLASVKFSAAAFRRYRCDEPLLLGVSLIRLVDVLKCAKDDDICTLRIADEKADVLHFVFEAKYSTQKAEYNVKRMNLDNDNIDIPETEYDVWITLPSNEFTRILRNLSQFGSSVRIEANKDGVRFTSGYGDSNGSIFLPQSDGIPITGWTNKYGDVDVEGEDRKKGEGEGEGEGKNKDDDPGERREDGTRKRRKKKSKATNKSNQINEMDQQFSFSFSLTYLLHFSKSANLSPSVHFLMGPEVPMLVMSEFSQGYIRYYLAAERED